MNLVFVGKNFTIKDNFISLRIIIIIIVFNGRGTKVWRQFLATEGKVVMDSLAGAVISSKLKGVTKDFESAVGLNEDDNQRESEVRTIRQHI